MTVLKSSQIFLFKTDEETAALKKSEFPTEIATKAEKKIPRFLYGLTMSCYTLSDVELQSGCKVEQSIVLIFVKCLKIL